MSFSLHAFVIFLPQPYPEPGMDELFAQNPRLQLHELALTGNQYLSDSGPAHRIEHQWSDLGGPRLSVCPEGWRRSCPSSRPMITPSEDGSFERNGREHVIATVVI